MGLFFERYPFGRKGWPFLALSILPCTVVLHWKSRRLLYRLQMLLAQSPVLFSTFHRWTVLLPVVALLACLILSLLFNWKVWYPLRISLVHSRSLAADSRVFLESVSYDDTLQFLGSFYVNIDSDRGPCSSEICVAVANGVRT